ncbi:MAG: Ig-like domain-containing protein [Alphaproteobacteria bacterium]
MAAIDDITKVYVGYFNRAPDLSGLNFWIGRLAAGDTLVKIANDFAANPEALNLYSYLSAPLVASPLTFLRSVYMNLFGRTDLSGAQDVEGLNYWTSQLANPNIPVGRVIVDIISGAQGNDRLVVINKAAVGVAFAQTQLLPGVIFNMTAASNAFTGVTADAATVTPAITRNDAVVMGTTDATAPVVSASQSFKYAENAASGVILGTVAATDTGGTGVNAFSIATGNTEGFFAIDAAGRISLTASGSAASAGSNDFEKAPNSFALGVVATDVAGNKSATTTVTLNETDVDDTAPGLVGATAAGATVSLNFNETLKAATLTTTSFTVVDSTNASLAINSVAVSGARVTLTTAATPSGAVKVSYTPAATGDVLQDAVGNKVAAITGVTAGTDATAPTLSATSPADNATGAAASSNIVLTFSENVVLGTGNITLTNAADATDTRTIAANDAGQVTVSGTGVTINPSADLKSGASYSVQIAATAVMDTSGNAFTGIASTDVTTLNFATAAAAVAGQTFTLTVGTNTFTGTAGGTVGDDIFDASGFFNTGTGTTLETLGTADNLDGTAGNDTLNVLLNTGSTIRPAALTSMDVINATFNAASTLDLATTTGLLTLNSANSTNTARFINAITAPTAFGLTNTAQNFSFTLGTGSTALAGATDSATLNLNGVTAGTVTLQPAATGSGFETLNIVSAGSLPNVLTALTGGNGTSLTTINISGAASLNLGNSVDASVVTVNAANSTGGVTVTQTNATALLFTGGSGNDTLVLGNTLDPTDVINGGGGLTDTLSLTSAVTQSVGSAVTNVTSTEILLISDALAGAINTTFFGSVIRLTLAGDSGNFNITIDSGDEVRFLASTTATPNLVIGGTGTGDTALVTLASAVNLAGDSLDASGVETLTINSLGAAGTTNTNFGVVMTNTAATETLVLTGAATLQFTNTLTADVINASALTGRFIMQADSTSGGGGITITGGTAAAGDVIRGTTGADILNGGDGNDNIRGNAGIDLINLGTGDDLLNMRNLAAGNELFASANRDNVTGFTATNTAFTTGGGIDRVGLNEGANATLTNFNFTAGAATEAQFRTLTTAAATTTLTAAEAYLELAFEFSSAVNLNAGGANELNGTTLLSALGATTGATAGAIAANTATTDAFIIAYQGGRAFLYGADNTTAANITASEIGLLGVFEGVAVGGFAPGNFVYGTVA